VGLAAFSLGDEWWVAVTHGFFGYAIALTPLLFVPNYMARRWKTSLPFLGISAAILYLTQFSSVSISSIESSLAFSMALPFYFAFIMLSEPRTSPFRSKEQLVYGSLMAVAVFAFAYFGSPYFMLASLLTGNAAYAIYRTYFKR
jgi:Na+-translocating ferredoxin:NAD+ oxidoreductase RnfD subunit